MFPLLLPPRTKVSSERISLDNLPLNDLNTVSCLFGRSWKPSLYLLLLLNSCRFVVDAHDHVLENDRVNHMHQ